MSWLEAAGAGLSFAGGAWANQQNLRESQRAREWSATMAGSAVQRHMIDLKAAGLNPILAAGGMSQTPGAATASVDDAIGPAVSTAMQAITQRKQLQLVDQQIAKAKEDARSSRYAANNAYRETFFNDQKWSYYFNDDGRPKPAMMDMLRAEYGATMASSARSLSEAKLSELSIPERESMARIFEQFGSGAKGMQMLLPLIMTLMRR